MTPDDYFTLHLPHRVNLLTAFRARFGPKPASDGRPRLNAEDFRDLFRCSKDIAMLMVRFFCGEMGLYLPKRNQGKHGGTELEESTKWCHQPQIKVLRFTEAEAKADKVKYHKLLAVMIAANRAVAHVNPADVDHPIRTAKEEDELCDVIDWIEELIQSHIYEPNNRHLKDAMKHPWNVMVSAQQQRAHGAADPAK